MAKKQEKSQQMSAPAPNRAGQIATLLADRKDKLLEVAPQFLSVERLTRLMVNCCSKNPKLLDCSNASLLQFAMRCAETGLEPIGPGGCYAIPFNNSRTQTVEIQFIADWRGLISVAKRAGLVEDVDARVVYAGDVFEYEFGTESRLRHVPLNKSRELTAAYAIVTLPSGKQKYTILFREDVEDRRERSAAWQNWLRSKRECPWNTDPAAMWRKSVIRAAMGEFQGISPALDAASAAFDFDFDSDAREARTPVPMPRAIDEDVEDTQPPPEPAADAAETHAGQGELPLQGGEDNDTNAQRM